VAERFKYEIEPMDLANMRQNGVRSLRIHCHQCLHEAVMNVDHLPGDLAVASFGPKMVCTKCAAWSVPTSARTGTSEIASGRLDAALAAAPCPRGTTGVFPAYIPHVPVEQSSVICDRRRRCRSPVARGVAHFI
jgi:hypothetical protein